LYDEAMMDMQLKSQLQHRIVVEGEAGMVELSETCAKGHMCCTKCHTKWCRMPQAKCPTCRGKLLPISSRKIPLYTHEQAVDMKLDSDSAQSRADKRNVNFGLPEFRVNTDLAKAIADQNVNEVFQLLLKGANANACLESGLPLVVYAASFNYWNIVTMLLHAGAHSSARNNQSEESLICMAVRAGDAKVVKSLLKDYMIEVKSLSPEGEHMLIEAANKGHWEIVFLLIDNGASADTLSLQGESVVDIAFRLNNFPAILEMNIRKIKIDPLSPMVENSLVHAASRGMWSYVFDMLDGGACSMVCNNENESLLCIAVRGNDLPSVQKLLETYRVPADSLSPTGEPLMIQAAATGHWEIVYLLLDHGACLQRESLADIAFRTSNYNAIEQLLTRNVQMDLSSTVAKNCVASAASDMVWRHVFFMLHAGACPTLCNAENESLLCIAVRGDCVRSVEKLLETYEVPADSLSPTGEPLMIEAATTGHWEIVYLFLQYGACLQRETVGDIAFRTSNYDAIAELMTRIDIDFSSPVVNNCVANAASRGLWRYVFFMLDAGARPTLCNTENESLLCIAVCKNDANIVEMLLKMYKVHPDSLSPNKEPLMIEAATRGHWTVVVILLNNGGNKNCLSLEGVSLVDIAIRARECTTLLHLIILNAGVDFLSPLVKDCLTDAAKKKDWINVFRLLDAGVSANSFNSNNESLLYIAICNNELEKVNKLLQTYLVPADSLSPTGKVVILTTVQKSFWSIVMTLLQHGASMLSCVYDDENILDVVFQDYDIRNARHHDAKKLIYYLIKHNVRGHLLSHQSECHLVILAKQYTWQLVNDMLEAGAKGNGKTLDNKSLIVLALQGGQTKIWTHIIERGVDTDLLLQDGETLIAWAAFANLWDAVALLLRRGASADTRTLLNESLLSIAVQRHNTSMVRVLIRHNANVNTFTKKQQSLIHTAILLKFADIYVLLLEAGAILDVMSMIGIIKNMYFWKIHLNIDNIMQALLQNTDINELCDDNNELLLPSLAFANEWEPVSLLLKYGASVLLFKDGETLIAKAAFANSWDIVELLLGRGASADTRTLLNESLLSIAVQRNNISMVGVLIRHNANVNTCTKTQQSLICTAVVSNFLDMYYLLQEAGAILDVMSMIGIIKNIFFWKIHLNIDDIMEELQQNTNINELYDDNNELLVPSLAFANKWEAVSYLLKYGASVHFETKLGESAISIAVQRNNDSIPMLLSYGALADSLTANKEHLVLFAAARNWWHIVQTLLSAGAPINCTDATGMTLLCHAVDQKNLEMVKYLHDKGIRDR